MVTSEVQDRVMLTGKHAVRDVMCKKCNYKLGWMYEMAMEESQRYKESKVILERALVREADAPAAVAAEPRPVPRDQVRAQAEARRKQREEEEAHLRMQAIMQQQMQQHHQHMQQQL